MPSVIEVTFPSKWIGGQSTGTSPGDNGYDAWSVFADQDGLTAWAWEAIPNGFARFNLSDGSILVQDNLFGDATGQKVLITKTNAENAVLWAQNGNSYFVLYTDSDTRLMSLYKFHVATGPAGNLLNGYCVVDGTLVMNATTPSVTFPEDMIAFTSNGVNYVCIVDPHFDGITNFSNAWVVNADTMALVGYHPATNHDGLWKSFLDKNGDLWICGDQSSSINNTSFTKWHPPDGAAAGLLNVTVNNVTPPPWFLLGFAFTYVPSTHSVVIGVGQVGSETGPVANVSLSTFAQNALHSSDGTFFLTGGFGAGHTPPGQAAAAVEAAMDVGIMSSGLLAIPGSLNPNTTQQGGVINIANPATLALQVNPDPIDLVVAFGHFGSPVYIVKGLSAQSSYNLTSIINSHGVATPIEVLAGQTVPFVSFSLSTSAAPPPPATPCAAVDVSGDPVNGVFISDLSLFIIPATALYDDLVPFSAIRFNEIDTQGRKQIILDFNNNEGLYVRDFGTIFTWSLQAGTILDVWQPSVIPMDGEIYDRLSYHCLMTSLGSVGWQHAREMNIAYAAPSPLTLLLVFDQWPNITLTLPSSASEIKQKLTLPPNKFKLVEIFISSANPFKLWTNDLEMKVKTWGSNEPYRVARPVSG